MTDHTTPDPRALVDALVGHRVRLTLVNGTTRTGRIVACGDRGLQVTSGIGGRILLYYGEIDAVDDLGD